MWCRWWFQRFIYFTYLLENVAFLLILFKRLETTTFVTPGSVSIFFLTGFVRPNARRKLLMELLLARRTFGGMRVGWGLVWLRLPFGSTLHPVTAANEGLGWGVPIFKKCSNPGCESCWVGEPKLDLDSRSSWTSQPCLENITYLKPKFRSLQFVNSLVGWARQPWQPCIQQPWIPHDLDESLSGEVLEIYVVAIRSHGIWLEFWKYTLPKTNPEDGWLEDEFPFGKAYFHGLCWF